jgi:hypothetical protein
MKSILKSILKSIIVTGLFVFSQQIVFAQDKKVMKIAKYIEKGKGTEAKELLDELDSKKEYQSDIYYWYVRTVYYRNAALANTDSPSELAEARKSFEKLVEFDRTDQSKSFTQYIPQIRKDLYEGKNQNSKSTGSSSTISQANDNGKTVTLTQIGQGKTKDAAKYNALRNAIEKAFGTFISSNTTLLNDELVKDEIVSVSTGNIQNFEILSETQMPDGSFTNVVKATVSIGKLTSFCESKGIRVEFKGGLFAANIKLQELNKKNEEAVMDYVFVMAKEIINKGTWDYTISTKTPQKNGSAWRVQLIVEASLKYSNFSGIIDIISGIKMSESEVSTYKEFNQNFYRIRDIFLRSRRSIAQILYLSAYLIPSASRNFIVSNGIAEYNFKGLRCETEGNYGYLKNQSTESISKIFFSDNNLWNFIRDYDHYNFLLSYNDEQWINNFSFGGSWIEKGYYGYYVDERRCFYFGDKLNTFTYKFDNIISTEDLSRISEYKIQPFIKN